MFVVRTKYYAGFKLAQSGIVFCGLGYSGTVTNEYNQICYNFDKVENAVIRKVELDINPKVKIQVKLIMKLNFKISIGIEQFIYG